MNGSWYSEKQGWNKIRIIRVHELRDQRTEFSWEDPFGLPVRGDRIRGQRPVKVLASTFYPLHFFVPCLSCSPFLLSLRLYSSSTLNSFHLSSPYLIWSFLIFLFFFLLPFLYIYVLFLSSSTLVIFRPYSRSLPSISSFLYFLPSKPRLLRVYGVS